MTACNAWVGYCHVKLDRQSVDGGKVAVEDPCGEDEATASSQQEKTWGPWRVSTRMEQDRGESMVFVSLFFNAS